MSTPLAVITADNHLRPNTWSKHPELRGDSYVSFEHVVSYCVEHKLPLFLLGDTFDATNPPADAVVFFATQIDRMARAGLAVYFIKGNHDDALTAWPQVHKHCRSLDQQKVNLGPFTIYGLDFYPAGELAEKLQQIPIDGVDILMFHQSWAEVQRIGHTDGSISQIPLASNGQIPVVFTGDYHVHKRYDVTTPQGVTVPVFSPGSTSMQALNEDPHKQFFVLGCEGRQAQVHSVSLPTRLFYGFDARSPDDFERVIAEVRSRAELKAVGAGLPEPIQKPILRVKFDDRIPEAYARLVEAAGDSFHVFDEPQHVSEDVVIDLVATPEGAFDSLLTAIGQLSAPGSEQYNGVRRLLESSDPKAELAAMYQEYLQRHGQAQPGQAPLGVPPNPVG